MNRIVFLSRKYCQGEAWCNRLLAYAHGFIDKGANVKLVFLISDIAQTNYKEDLNGVDANFITEGVNTNSKIKKIWWYLTSLFRLRTILNSNDIIFTTDGGGLFLLFLHLFYRENRIFSEITEHPIIFGAPKGYDGLIKRLKMVCHRLHVKLNNSLLKKNAGIFTITNSLCNYYLMQGVSPQKICVINMFVDVKRFDLPETECEPYIAYCGTLSIDKDGVDILLKSFDIFHKAYPQYMLHLIGPFQNQKTERAIKEIINQLCLNDYVCLVGRVPPSEMPKQLINAKILTLSRPDNLQNRNGFPTKLGEYLATGRPVVITRIGEIPLFIKDGVNGYLAEPNSVDSFAEKLKEVAFDYNNSKKIGIRGRELAFNEFSSETQTEKALNFINTTL